MAKRARKLKRVPYTLLRPEAHVAAYKMLDMIASQFHPELGAATIALAWCESWRMDPDGRITLGKCKRASDLDRELQPAYDFVILLNREFWTSPAVTDTEREALLDHELCHASVKRDEHGEPMENERGRKVYRLRKHDVEEFSDVIARHGLWKRDLEAFARVIARTQRTQPELFSEEPNGSAQKLDRTH